jgi:hypothetical protein
MLVLMKKRILWAGLVLVGIAAAVLWLNRQRSSPPTAPQPVAEARQPSATNITTQTASGISTQAELDPSSEKPPPATSGVDEISLSRQRALSAIPRGPIPDADRKDDELWRKTPEATAVWDEIVGILVAAEARETRGENPSLTTNEVEILIAYMQSPHYFVRWKAVIGAGRGFSDPAKSMLLPHVISLLSDPVYIVRFWAADTLGAIGDTGMIPYLEPLLNDHPEVAGVAQRAISKLQQKETVPKDH